MAPIGGGYLPETWVVVTWGRWRDWVKARPIFPQVVVIGRVCLCLCPPALPGGGGGCLVGCCTVRKLASFCRHSVGLMWGESGVLAGVVATVGGEFFVPGKILKFHPLVFLL